MPFTICELHGGAVAPHGCRHVAEAVGARKPRGHATHVNLDGFFLMGWVCDECLDVLNRNGLQAYLARKEASHDYPPQEEIDPLLELLDLQPMCAKCFEELFNESSFQA